MFSRNARRHGPSIEPLEGRAALSGGLTSSLAAHARHPHAEIHRQARGVEAIHHSTAEHPAAAPGVDDPTNHDANDLRHGRHDGAGHA